MNLLGWGWGWQGVGGWGNMVAASPCPQLQVIKKRKTTIDLFGKAESTFSTGKNKTSVDTSLSKKKKQ